MAKYLLGGFIIVICTLVGKKSTSKYYEKLKYYECLRLFNLYLKQNLMFKRDNLLNLLNYDSKNIDFNTTLNSVKVNKCYRHNQDVYLPSWVNDDDVYFILNYFDTIGFYSVDAEVENIRIQEELINEKVSKIADKSNKYSNLGQKIGFSLGMAIFIIIL